MSSKKTVIHEFDPCIYPRLLWVVKCIDKVRKYKEVKHGSSESKCCNQEDI